MNVEKTSNNPFETLNTYLDKLQELQDSKEDNATPSLTPKKDYGILKLSNDDEEDFSNLTFDDSVLKAGSTQDTNTQTTTPSTSTATKSGASTSDKTTSNLDKITEQITEAATTLENVETLLENYEASNENLLAQIQQGKAGDTTINVSKCQKQYNEQQEQIALLSIKKLNLTNQINALKDIQEYQNSGAVTNANSEDKTAMLNILEKQQTITNKIADVRAKKLAAMEKGDTSAVEAYAQEEKSLGQQNRTLELNKLKQFSVINRQYSSDMKVFTDAQLSELGLQLDAKAKADEAATNKLYYTSLLSQLESQKETTGDKNTLRSIEQQIWKINQIVSAYENEEKSLKKALNTYNVKGTTDSLSTALSASDVNPQEMMKDDGNYSYNEKDILYKDGKKYTGEYCGKMYKKGKLFNGKITDKTKVIETTTTTKKGAGKNRGSKTTTTKKTYAYTLYVNGEKFNGTKGKIRYVNGELAQGEVDGFMYQNGKTLTGLTTFTPMKADGKTPDTENTITRYYKKGQLGTGKYKGVRYANGVPFTGQYKNKTYVNGIKQ